jgi:hypothetical protein
MHRFDVISFAFGLVFIAVASVALLDLPADLGRWVLPVSLLGVGAAVAVAAVASGRFGDR